MLGLMQNQPLLISSLIEFAARHHFDAEIVSRRVEGDIHRYTYKDLAGRSRQLAHALDGMGLAQGDRVAAIVADDPLRAAGGAGGIDEGREIPSLRRRRKRCSGTFF